MSNNILICLAILFVVIAVGFYFLRRRKTKHVSYSVIEEHYEHGGIQRRYRLKTSIRLSDDKIISDCMDGEEYYFYPSGAINRKNLWKDNKQEGPFTVFYEDGTTYISGEYKNGKLHGMYNVYDKNNKVIWSKKY